MVCVRIALLPLMLLSLARQVAEGHSWIDCLDTNLTKIYNDSASYIYGSTKGNGFCEGYAAGYQGRGRNTIGTEYTYKILKNEVEAGAPICEDVGPNPYKDWCTRVSVPPEVEIHFAYLPNGHIVKDKKAVGTQHGIYWTGQVGTSLTSTHDMIPKNLVTGKTMDFDDGNCGETVDINGNPSGRAGDGKPCIGSFAIPKGSPPGIYKMVWYWEFWLDNPDAYKDPTLARGYFGAAYTSCFEVEVTSGGGDGNGSTTSNAESPPVEKSDSPDASMAPELGVAAEANQLTPLPPSTATQNLTPLIAATSSSMGSDAENASSNTSPLPEAVSEAAQMKTPAAASSSMKSDAENALSNMPPLSEAVSEAAQKETPAAAFSSMKNDAEDASSNMPPLPEAVSEAAQMKTPAAASSSMGSNAENASSGTSPLPEAVSEAAQRETPAAASSSMGSNAENASSGTSLLPEAVSEAAQRETPAAASSSMKSDTEDASSNMPPLSEAVSEAAQMKTPEAATPDSTTPVPEPARTDMPDAATFASTAPVSEAEAPTPVAHIPVEPPAAPMVPPVVPKSSPKVPASSIPSSSGCRARVRSSVVI